MVLAIAHHAVHTHTQLMPHTHTTQETDQGQAHHWLWLFVSHHHHAGLALSLSCLLRFLSTIPFSLSLSSMRSHAPHVLITTIMPSIPCVCVCGVLWGWTAPSTTVVVKHATHTLVDHCVDGSHHPTLHPPSTLTPFCAFATTNHHAIPLLQPPPHTTRPLCSSTAHSSASHTHMVCMACAFVAALTFCVWCVWMACISHHIVHTQPQPLWLCPSPHHHSLVCVWMETRATWPCPTTNHSLAWRGLLAFFTSACNQALCHPPCVCGGLVVGLCWCGHLCECLCVGWLCCFPPHCVSCVPPCPHPSVSPHSLALVLLLVMVVIGGG